jgi:hypothetical protein
MKEIFIYRSSWRSFVASMLPIAPESGLLLPKLWLFGRFLPSLDE